MNSSLFVLHSSLNLFLIQDFQLLANTLLVDMLKDLGSKLRAHSAEGSLGTTLLENLVVAVGLYDGHIVLLLVGTNLAAYTHTLSQEIHQLVVALINLTAQLMQTLCRIMLITNYEEAQDVIQDIWSNLLLGIAPCIVRRCSGSLR